MCEHREEESIIARLTRERDEARKDALVANRALRSIALQETQIHEIEGKITVDQTQEIGQEFARLMFQMLVSTGAANCLEWIVEHPEEGRFTLTLQRCNGKSPMDLRNEERDRADHLDKLLRFACGHGNMEEADWNAGMEALIKKWKESDANANGCDPWTDSPAAEDDAARQVGEATLRDAEPCVVGPCSTLREAADRGATFA